MAIARRILDLLNANREAVVVDPGVLLEQKTGEMLAERLPMADPARSWRVSRRQLITDFAQYEHLARLKRLTDADPMLRTEVGQDYLVAPDVTVGLELPHEPLLFLHAAVSCKWSIRSDRVQNIRHEGVILTRHRRGRQPHIVTVTAEPLPSRLASIARGTGEVDAVYHLCLDELITAATEVGPVSQMDVLNELISQRRLFGMEDLLLDLLL